MNTNKPKFDPSKPFEEAKPKFDPTQKFDVVGEDATAAAPPAEDPRGRKISDAEVSSLSSFDNEDEIKAAVAEAPTNFNDFMAAVREGVPLSGYAKKLAAKIMPGKYDDNVAAQKKEVAERAERNPRVDTAGNIVGGMLAPGPKGGFFSKTAQNAGLAAADAAGRADSMDEAKSDALLAGGTSAAIDTFLAGLGKAGKFVGSLDKTAERRAVKSLDPILNQQEMLARKGNTEELGRELLDSKAVSFGSSVDNMAPRVEDILKDKGKRIGEIREAADAAGASVDMSRLRDKGNAMAAFSDATNESAQETAEAYARNAGKLSNVPERSIQEAQQEILALDKNIPFERDLAKHTPAQQAYRELRGDIVGQVDDQVRQLTPDSAPEYQKLKDEFGLFKDADKILDKSTARQARNNDIGLRELLAANAAAKKGGIEGGVWATAAGLGTKLARERGNSALAVTADKASKLLKYPVMLGKFAKPLQEAMSKGSETFMMTHMLLMKVPEYKALVEKEGSVP